MRVSVRRTDEPPEACRPSAARACREPELAPVAPRAERRSSASRRRWSAPSTARRSRARRRSSRSATSVAPGQTLCILEAMKLMNEVKAEIEAIVRAIHVENAQPVEFGQLLFELEPLGGRPLDAV